MCHFRIYTTTLRKSSENEPSTYLFWTLVLLLFILAFGNLVLTFVVLGVLRLGEGMESLELVPEKSLIKFFGNTDLDNIYKRDGKLESFNESPMEILGDIGNIQIGIVEMEREITPLINLGTKLEVVKNVESFVVRNPASEQSYFSTDYPNFGLPRGVNKLDIQVGHTKRISSAVDDSLLLRSDSFVKLKGSEGIHISGKELFWSADRDIILKSLNRSIVLDGDNGVFLDVRSIPITNKGIGLRSHAQYKICVCMPEGKLFRIIVPPGQTSLVGCQVIDHSLIQNPCL